MTGLILLLIRTIMALALYAFLGLVLYTVWRDIQQQKTSIQNEKMPEIRLKIIHGEKTYNRDFQENEVTLGRDPVCECHLPSDTVSARHARFSHHHGHWWLEDLESTNGTLINNTPISTGVVTAPGDQIEIGELKIIILES